MPTTGSGNLTDLNGTTWYFNETLDLTGTNFAVEVNFKDSANYTYNQIGLLDGTYGYQDVQMTDANSGTVYTIYRNGSWIYPESRLITFTSSCTVVQLIEWIQNNATQITVNITDLTGTKWRFNETVICSFSSTTFDITFTSEHTTYQNCDQLMVQMTGSSQKVAYRPIGATSCYEVYTAYSGWIDAGARNIEITGGNDVANMDLIAWLLSNAVWVNEPHDIIILYNYLPIASLDDTGTKTLLTAGKYCQDNIVIDYTKTVKQIYMDWALNPSGFYFDASNSEHTEVLNGLSTIGNGAFMQRAFSGNFTFSSMSVVPSYAFAAGTYNMTTPSFTAVFPTATSIYNYAFQYNNGIQSIDAPNCLSIGSYAFYSCYSLVSANFPNCTSISSQAFQNCSNLTSINFSNCTSIGSWAFYNCFNLTSVSFPSCTSIAGYAFASCSKLANIYFPNTTRIETYAFQGCSSLTSLDFPKATSTGVGAFDKCSYVTSVNLPSITTLGGYTFRSCYRIPSVNFSKCTTIGSYAFCYCSALSQVNIPSAISISSYAFNSCSSLTEVSFPDCSSAYSSAFLNCTNMTQAYFGKLKTIGNYAFSGCSKLESLIIASTAVATLGTGALTNTAISKSTYLGRWGSIFVPSSLVASYKAATNWVTFSARITSIV